ncbi:MAG: hypothetical protein H6735_09995 [Alphaproteobacteria bacterium]|nr:hypothetical protein [Alphaproteobacteria bacterium]
MLADQVQAFLKSPEALPQVTLPAIEAPSLEGVQVIVHGPPELDADTLQLLYQQHLERLAPRRRLAVGEFAEPGDVLMVAMGVFTLEGAALPFTFQAPVELTAGGGWLVAEVPAALVGRTEGELFEVPVVFPDDWPAPWLRGAHAVFRIRVRSVERLDLPDADDPQLLPKLGITLSLNGLMAALRDQWIEERSDELVAAAEHTALDELLGRVDIPIATEAVDAQIWRYWARDEGAVILELGGGEADLHATLASWLRSHDLRRQVERAYRLAALLSAIARRSGIEVRPQDLEVLIAEGAAGAGVDPDVAARAFREDPGQALLLADRALQRRIVRHVLDLAEVRIVSD